MGFLFVQVGDFQIASRRNCNCRAGNSGTLYQDAAEYLLQVRRGPHVAQRKRQACERRPREFVSLLGAVCRSGGESSGVDPKTMGISNIPGEPAGVAIILKEPGKADADDVTKMFPKDGNIGEAGYEAPRESHNVAYNHEWWTCLCDEERKKRHIEVCCKNGRDGGYKGRCARYGNHFRNLCSLVSPAIDAPL